MIRLLQRLAAAQARPAEAGRLFGIIAEEVAALVDAEGAIMGELECDALVQLRVGTGSLASAEGELLPLEGSLVGTAIRTGEAQQSTDLSADVGTYPRERALRAGPAIAMPLRFEGESLGALLAVRTPGAVPFSVAERERLGAAAEAAASALQTWRQYARAREGRARVEAWRNERRLRLWLARYQALARTQGADVFEYDPETDRIRWGDLQEPARDAGGAGQEEPGGERFHPEEYVRILEGLRRLAPGEAMEAPVRLRGADGAYRSMRLRAEAASGSGPHHVGGVVTPVPAAGSRTTEEGAYVQQVIRALRHEMNNPLATILGETQLLSQDQTLPEGSVLEQSVQTIYQESRRLNALTQRLAAMEQHPGDLQINEIGGLIFSEDRP